LAAEFLQCDLGFPQGLVKVAGDRQGPRHGQLGHRVQEGVGGPGKQRCQALAGRQRRGVVADVDGDHRRRPGQLGSGLRVQRTVGGQELLDPGPGLVLQVQPRPEQPQDLE